MYATPGGILSDHCMARPEMCYFQSSEQRPDYMAWRSGNLRATKQ